MPTKNKAAETLSEKCQILFNTEYSLKVNEKFLIL